MKAQCQVILADCASYLAKELVFKRGVVATSLEFPWNKFGQRLGNRLLREVLFDVNSGRRWWRLKGGERIIQSFFNWCYKKFRKKKHRNWKESFSSNVIANEVDGYLLLLIINVFTAYKKLHPEPYFVCVLCAILSAFSLIYFNINTVITCMTSFFKDIQV